MPDTTHEPATAFAASRRIGDSTVTVISWRSFLRSHSGVHQPSVAEDEWRVAMSDADGEGMTPHASTAVHLAIGGASILVDTAARENLPPEVVADPSLVRSPGLVAGLAHIGVVGAGQGLRRAQAALRSRTCRSPESKCVALARQ